MSGERCRNMPLDESSLRQYREALLESGAYYTRINSFFLFFSIGRLMPVPIDPTLYWPPIHHLHLLVYGLLASLPVR